MINNIINKQSFNGISFAQGKWNSSFACVPEALKQKNDYGDMEV